METWNIFRITDYNECPPQVTFYNTAKDRYDAVELFKDQGKDLALIQFNVIPVQRVKRDVVELLNLVSASPKFGGLEDEEPVQEKRAYRHLRLVK